MERDAFIAKFGSVFEHSPWIAAAAFDAGIADYSAEGIHAALCRALASASPEAKLALLNAHPDLAGKLALAKGLTAESTAEQAGAGLDRLTPSELARFTELNDAYKARFGFPFIIAVKGLDKHAILAAFEARVGNTPEVEFTTALEQVRRIALLRLRQMPPQSSSRT